ncbi:MAG: DNA translocase FtsK 4TM domain-containing protein, partial [Clostridia bacterium]|nr:DNA translocase FtsK 4TM domain-containing protein [Clostridia bacterium]
MGRPAKPKPDAQKKKADPRPGRARLIPPLLSLLALVFALCLLGERCGFDVGFLGRRLFLLFAGLFGGGAVLIPLLLVFLSLRAREDLPAGRFLSRSVFALLFLFLFSVVLGRSIPAREAFSYGTALSGGGAVGSLLRRALLSSLGPAGILLFPLLVVLFYFVFFPPAEGFAFPYPLPALFARRERTAPPPPEKTRKEPPMSSRQSKPTIVGGDGYYPVSHREEETFSEIRAKMEKEERTGAERK